MRTFYNLQLHELPSERSQCIIIISYNCVNTHSGMASVSFICLPVVDGCGFVVDSLSLAIRELSLCFPILLYNSYWHSSRLELSPLWWTKSWRGGPSSFPKLYLNAFWPTFASDSHSGLQLHLPHSQFELIFRFTILGLNGIFQFPLTLSMFLLVLIGQIESTPVR